jgi:3-oxoacyl-[acyl-carrier protein] reductase
MDIKGKNAVITGASRGIGKSIALKLAASGVNITLAARGKETLDETVKEIKSKYKVKVIGVATGQQA